MCRREQVRFGDHICARLNETNPQINFSCVAMITSSSPSPVSPLTLHACVSAVCQYSDSSIAGDSRSRSCSCISLSVWIQSIDRLTEFNQKTIALFISDPGVASIDGTLQPAGPVLGHRRHHRVYIPSLKCHRQSTSSELLQTNEPFSFSVHFFPHESRLIISRCRPLTRQLGVQLLR